MVGGERNTCQYLTSKAEACKVLGQVANQGWAWVRDEAGRGDEGRRGVRPRIYFK